MWSDSTIPNGGAIRSARKRRVHAASETWRAIDGVRHPFGVPRFGWFRLQGLRCRSTTCLWSSTPTGFTRPDERMNANSTRGQTSFRRENECQLNERANAASTRERMPLRREDNRQSPQASERRQITGRWWSPQGRNPCVLCHGRLTNRALKGRKTTGRGEARKGVTPVNGHTQSNEP